MLDAGTGLDNAVLRFFWHVLKDLPGLASLHALCKLLFFLLGEVLDGRGHQGCINHLSAACHEPLAQ